MALKRFFLTSIVVGIFFTVMLCFFVSCETLSLLAPPAPEGETPEGAELTADPAPEEAPEQEAPPAPAEVEAEAPEPFFADGTPVVTADTVFDGKDTVLMTFAGDIMAHTPNTARGHYDKIYEDIRFLLQASPLAFANMEAPVDNSKPFETYPTFNVQNSYPDAAIDAGFTVFSLANNHTNDQGAKSMVATKKYFDDKAATTADTERPVYSSGLHNPGEPFTYQLIESNGWKILFLAVTEILNQGANASYINYIKTDAASRADFMAYLRQLRQDNPCDLFVLSMHCAEAEYVLTVAKRQKQYYYDLLDAGVDILWANHPHVAKDWDVVTDQGNVPRKIIFYAMGNTISAQRSRPAFNTPRENHEYTGDGYITQTRFLRDEQGIRIVWVNPVLITTYITPEGLFVIRRLDDAFISELKDENRTVWATYLQERKTLMERIKGSTIWQ